MKAIIPLAGKGTRLRPHTHILPKPLVRVAGKPVLDLILDDLRRIGVTETIFVVGHLQDAIRAHVDSRYGDLAPRYVVQEVQNGTAGAVALAEPWVNEDVLILFADTVFEVDLGRIRTMDPASAGAIWAREVEDYRRYGVIVTDSAGNMTRIVEKPEEPVSRLANIGLYHIRDHALFFRGIRHVLAGAPGRTGEFYLTDALQFMVDAGARIATEPVEAWLDTGNVPSLLAANRHLLERGRAGVDNAAQLQESDLSPMARIEEGAAVTASRIGDNVTVEAGAKVRDSDLQDTIVGAGAIVERCRLRGSLVGGGAVLKGFSGSLSVVDHSEVCGE